MATNLLGYARGLIGGAANDLDNIKQSTMRGWDPTFVISTGPERTLYWYQYSSASTATEKSPAIVMPDTAAGTSGRHILAHSYRKQFIINCTAAVSLGATNLGNHITYTNYGASSSLVKLTAPEMTSDLTGCGTKLIQMSCGKLSIVANTSQYWRYGTQESAKGSKLESTVTWNSVTIQYMGNNRWILHPIDGIWNYTT